MVTQLQPDVRAYLHGAEVIKRYIRVEVQAAGGIIVTVDDGRLAMQLRGF